MSAETTGPGPAADARSTAAGTYAPKPGAAPLPRMIATQAALETRMLLRNGEQLLLTVIIPTLLLVLFSAVDIVDTGDGEAVDFLAPGILALAVMSTAFTGQAIATGFERRYGVLKRLAVSPLPRWGLMTAKTLSVLVTEILQVVLVTVIALALGWSPHGNPFAVLLLLILGTAAFSGLGLLMAGTLKAEATLAAANLVFLLLLIGGGVIVPLDKFPQGAQDVLGLLPISALSEGLRDVLQHGAGMPWGNLGILAVWAVVGLAAAGRFFRWE
ncbi:ABC transporter permease [Streptomyces tauricus]|uniref:ABC transporter permease n=1 Tax=Streptomyces tauricus TaxID=68274 RepID=UPI003410E038